MITFNFYLVALFWVKPLWFFLLFVSVFLCRRIFPIAQELTLGPIGENNRDWLFHIKTKTNYHFGARLMSTGLNKEFRITMSHHFSHPFLSL